MIKTYNIAIVGATGLVGRKMLQVLDEHNFPINEIKLFASKKSVGTKITFKNQELIVEELNQKSFQNIDIALFSAGSDISKEYAPIAADSKCIVIDNSSAWRMDENVPLVVPEVNSNSLFNHKYIIANPNCSTIQLVVALNPLHKNYNVKRVVCSTYQSVSGAGQKGIDKLKTELSNDIYDNNIKFAYNTVFHPFAENGFTIEENKMINELHKILDDKIQIAVTCVRVPTLGGHSESINIEFEKEFEIEDIRYILSNSEGIVLMDNFKENVYPYPEIVNDTDFVYVGRLRKDTTIKNGLYMWVVADNLRKGAATNAVQIAEKMIELDLI